MAKKTTTTNTVKGPVRTIAQVKKDVEGALDQASKDVTKARNSLKNVDNQIAQARRTRDKLAEQIKDEE